MKQFLEDRDKKSISNIKFNPQEIERTKFRLAEKKLPNFNYSRSLKYDPWEALKFRKSAWNNKKYNLDTPFDILQEALIEDRISKGFRLDQVRARVEGKMKLALVSTKH